ncbi:cell wall hydrolase [Clostridium perfringens]|nr:cell wall hydrolase [Clostridium perfringens]
MALLRSTIIKKMVLVWAVTLGVTVPSSLYIKQVNNTQRIQEELRIQNEKYKQLEKNFKDQQSEMDSVKKKNKELEAKNQELEEVRSHRIKSIGYTPTAEEVRLLEKLVEAEAGAEPYRGKIAVANVVFNRIKSNQFPNSIKDVIYQKNQFEPVVTGMIYRMNPSSDSKRAVKEALNGERVVASDIVNFWADYLPKSHELWKHIPVEFKIGTHCFGKGWID